MFTGLIEDVGTLKSITRRGNYRILTISSRMAGDGLTMGESIACDGSCLTVVSFDRTSFTVEASQETEAKTTLSDYRVARKINLERAVLAGGRLGGHYVTGHIDCIGHIESIRPVGESTEIWVSHPEEFNPLVVPKGSIAVDGISLTVNQVVPGRLSVNLIPHSVARTTVSALKAGRAVNMEFDLIGKYVLKMQQTGAAEGLSKKKLLDSGWKL